jgi:transposase
MKLWCVKEFTHTLQQYKKSESVDAYTITGLTTLKAEAPIIYNLTSGASNGENFADFMVNDCLKVLHRGDYIIGDNMNYHVSGWTYEAIAPVLREMGINYKSLPTYSPELNPIELVWAWLKKELAKLPLHSDIVESVVTLLGKLKHDQIIGYYEKCGYI